MLLSIEGEESTGKTTLAYSGPLPIVGFSFDMGTERALYGAKFDTLFKDLKIEVVPYVVGSKPEIKWRTNDITVYELPQPIQLTPDALVGFTDQWNYFITLFGNAVQDQRIRTIVVDTMTLARRIKADAYLQELQEGNKGKPRKQLLQIEYGHANDSIRNMYTIMAGMKKNLIAIHHLTDERKDGIDRDGAVVSMISGNRILEGLVQTYRYVDVAIRMSKKDSRLVGTFIKCGYSLDLEGNPVPSPTWDSITSQIVGTLGGRIHIDRRNVEVTAK